jgi:hypothetical protein
MRNWIYREKAADLIWYTSATCPLKAETNLPVIPFHSFTDLSKEALASHCPSGEK